jgi:four helix bundle protein
MAVVRNVQDLVAWQRANQFWEAVNPLLDRPGFRNDPRLRAQLGDALDSVLSNITEGFEQPTDRAFAKFLYNAKGSTAEARARLLIARKRRFITQEEHQTGDKARR